MFGNLLELMREMQGNFLFDIIALKGKMIKRNL